MWLLTWPLSLCSLFLFNWLWRKDFVTDTPNLIFQVIFDGRWHFSPNKIRFKHAIKSYFENRFVSKNLFFLAKPLYKWNRMAPGNMCRSNPEYFVVRFFMYVHRPGQIEKWTFKTFKYPGHPRAQHHYLES